MRRELVIFGVLLVCGCSLAPSSAPLLKPSAISTTSTPLVPIATPSSAPSSKAPSTPISSPDHAWNVSQTRGDGYIYLVVTGPGGKSGRAVLKSPHKIESQAISNDGTYLAYVVSNETGTGVLWVQKLVTGMRLKLLANAGTSGTLAFSGSELLYSSKEATLAIPLSEIETKLRKAFGA